jgi:phosphoglycerate dehydrogenase-like enzyme
VKKALFLQKPELIDKQKSEIFALSSEFLPEYKLKLIGSSSKVFEGDYYDLVITSFLDFLPDVLKKIKKTPHIHFTSSGIDKLDDFLNSIDLEGVKITNSAGVNSISIAEHVIAGILMFAKNLHIYRDQQKESLWKRYWHNEIAGQKVCIIGLGNIGKQVASRCNALKMNVTGCDTNLLKEDNCNEIISPDQLVNKLSVFDYVVLCLPLNQNTEKFFNSSLLECMNDASILLNVSRGEIIDEDALLESLTMKKIKGAVLDVFNDEPLASNHAFWKMENVILTPHVAGTTQHYMRNMFRVLGERL